MKNERNEKIFKKINEEEYSNKGKIAAIEPESGDYFIADSIIEAYKKAQKKHPSKEFIFKRIGFPSAHFVGTF